MLAGLLLAWLTLFMLPMSIRETSTAINRRGYILDELQLDTYREGLGRRTSTRLEGHIVSSGERFVTDSSSIVGLDRLRELKRENKVEGHRLPVRYLRNPSGFWAALDRACQFRVRTREDFDSGLPYGLVATNLLFAFLSVIFIRRAVSGPKA